MDLQDFNDLLKSADNKLSIFTDFTVLQNQKKYNIFTNKL